MILYWNSTEIYIFIKHHKSSDFLHFLADKMFHAALTKQIRCKFCAHGINRKIFREVHPLYAPLGSLGLKTAVLIGLITKW